MVSNKWKLTSGYDSKKRKKNHDNNNNNNNNNTNWVLYKKNVNPTKLSFSIPGRLPPYGKR